MSKVYRWVGLIQIAIWAACILTLVAVSAQSQTDPVVLYISPVGDLKGGTMNITGEYMEKVSIPGVYYSYLNNGKVYVQSKYGAFTFIESNIIWYVVPKKESICSVILNDVETADPSWYTSKDSQDPTESIPAMIAGGQ